MRSVFTKQFIAVFMCFLIIVASVPITPVYAGDIPSKYSKYVTDGRVDYASLHDEYFKSIAKNGTPSYALTEPTSRFTVSVTRNGKTVATGYSDQSSVLYAQVGDTLSISNNSTAGSGKNFSNDKCDFQVSNGTSIIGRSSSFGGIKLDSISTSVEGTYNIYLSVMDNENMTRTEGWGNWSYNGTHVSPGINPGGGTGSDFPGWWYYSKLTVEIRKPEYTLQEKHIASDSGTVLSTTNYTGITNSTMTTSAKSFTEYDFIGSRAGYTWEDIANGDTTSLSSNTANFDITHPSAFHYYYYRKSITVPPPPGTADIVVYYKDKVTGEAVAPPDETTYIGVAYGTYSIPAKVVSGYTLDVSTPSPKSVVVDASNDSVIVTFYYNATVASTGKPPIAVITGPLQKMAGESVSFSGSSSYDPDGTIVNYIWNIPGSNHIYTELSKKSTRVWYPYEGEYDLDLTVVDNDGLTGDCMTSIKITPPIPVAAIDITGKLKENRKVTVTGGNSTSPTYYPINKYTWTMTNGIDARYIGTFGSGASKDMLLKKAQTYRFDLRVDNTYGLSDTESKSITIVSDIAPTADFSVSAQILRNPNDSNYSTITVTNNSKSTDGDTIKKTVLFYAYDSDNDGNFDEETWYMSKDGTTWTASGLTYASLNSLDLYNLAGASNPANFVLKTKQVGKYKFEANTIEDIAAADTIPSLLAASDYKTGITTTAKPLSAKIVEVINTAPQITFEVKKKKEADIFIFTDYTGAKLDSLKAAIDVKRSQLTPLNVDANFIVVNNSKNIGTQSLKKYRFYRNWFFNRKVTEGSGTNLSISPISPYFIYDSGLWEERIDYDKPLSDIPITRPYSYYRYMGSKSYRGSNYERDYNEYRFYDTLGGYEDITATTYYNSNGFYRDYNSWSIIGAGVDPAWTRDTYISTDTFNVTSIDLAKIQTLTLRPNSDRYAFFLSDAAGNDYSGSFGTAFAFGDLTDTVQNYLKNNNFRISVIAPNTILDANLLGEKVSDIVSTGYYGFYTSFDGRTKSLGTFYPKDYNDIVYPYDRGTNFGKIAEAYSDIRSYNNELGNFLIMANGTVKKQTGYNNDTFTTVPNLTGIVKMAGEYFLRANGDCFSESGVLVATNVSLLGENPITSRECISFDDGTDIYYDIFILNDGSIYATNPTNTGSHYVYEEYYTYDASGNQTRGPYYRKVTGAKCKVGKYILKTNGDLVEMVRYGTKNGQFIIYENLWSGYYHYLYKITTGVSSLEKFSDTYILTMTNGTKKYIYIEKRPLYDKYGDIRGYSYVPTGPFDITGPENDVISNYTFTDGWGDGATFLLTSDGKLRYQGVRQEGSIIFNTIINSTPKLTNIKSFDGRIALTNDGKAYYLSKYDYRGCTFTLLNINNVDKIVTKEYVDQSNYNYLKKYITYILTKDNLLYALGDSKYGQAGIISGQINTPTIPNKPNVSLTQPALNYQMLRDVLNLFPDSRYYATGQYTKALDDLLAIYAGDTTYTTNYILVNDAVSYTTAYSDYENDSKYTEEWKFLHEPYWFDNSMGVAPFHGQTLAAPVIKYTQKGRYTINLKARDNPKNDVKFKNDTNEAYNYYKWSTGNQNVLLYVHEKPIALARAAITKNSNDTYTVKAMDAGSYDPDHNNSRADKGIASREWRWKKAASSAWTNGQMNKTDCTADESYVIQLRVKDIEGVWSDYYTITIDKDNPPVALFSLDKTLININDPLKVRDQSFPQSFSTITSWHWVVKKLNTDGTAPGTNLQNAIFTTSNAGTEALVGYDSNIKTNYAANGVGSYRVYLRVKDSNGLWSDGGTNSTIPADLSKYYSMDFDVDKAPTASFTVAKSVIRIDELLKVTDTSATTGISGIARWHWIVKKLNDDGTLPTANVQNEIYTDSNTGTDGLSGYDRNVEHDYRDHGTGKYRIYLRGCNGNGMWSDGGTDATFNLGGFFYRDVVVDAPPTASFSIETNPIEPSEVLRLKDTSTTAGVSPLDRWHWIIKKLDPDGSEPEGDLLNGQYPTHNAGTGVLKGYEANIITDYSELGPGTYRIFLRVRNANGIWSDSFFQRDLIVRESFKICNFRVVKVKDLHLEDFYYNPATGQYDDRPMDVNSMAVDRNNFSGMVEGLTKGYSFEFEIDTVNFNGSGDEIIISPHFYTCDSSGRDAEERELYWENSDHEILKAGQGGHASWVEIRLGREDRVIKDGNKATWRGSYLIPGTAWAVPKYTTKENAVSKKLKKDIIVSFEIKGYKDGVIKFDYNLRQWPLERDHSKWHYEIGDVIRYDHTKCNLDDNKVILNRP